MPDINEPNTPGHTNEPFSEKRTNYSSEQIYEVLKPLFQDFNDVLKKYGVADLEVADFTLLPVKGISRESVTPAPPLEGNSMDSVEDLSIASVVSNSQRACEKNGGCWRQQQGGGGTCVNCETGNVIES